MEADSSPGRIGLGAGVADGSATPIASPLAKILVRGRHQRRFSAPYRPKFAGQPGGSMSRNPVLQLPLSSVLRHEIALPLQHILKLYTVGSLLKAWRNPRNHKGIEQVFDSPEQAHHAVAVCATWLGINTLAHHEPVPAWWRGDERIQVGA
jgi:hypothetical protein